MTNKALGCADLVLDPLFSSSCNSSNFPPRPGSLLHVTKVMDTVQSSFALPQCSPKSGYSIITYMENLPGH